MPRSATLDKGFSGRGHTGADLDLLSHLDVRHAGPANVTASSAQEVAEFADNSSGSDKSDRSSYETAGPAMAGALTAENRVEIMAPVGNHRARGGDSDAG